MVRTKAERLSDLSETVLGKFLLPQIIVTRKQLACVDNSCLSSMWKFVKSFSADCKFVVRSSHHLEDLENNSHAGKYLSIVGIDAVEIVDSAIEVLNSYGTSFDTDQVLLQPFLNNSSMSGVIFNVDPQTGSPYRIINYSIGSDTDAVTSGKKSSSIVFYDDYSRLLLPPFNVFADEIQQILNFFSNPVDIEFACQDEKFYILQWRPLKVENSISPISEITEMITQAIEGLNRTKGKHPYLAGKTTVFGLMPDWNPAELIGFSPTALAFSLYRELITDSSWAYERSNLGYRNTRSFPLVIDLAGHPYVDVRVSANSLIPSGITEDLADRMVDAYIEHLIENQHLHDKVEFEVYLTCWTIDFSERFAKYKQLFNSDEKVEIENNLKVLTIKMLSKEEDFIGRYLAKVDLLRNRCKLICNSDMDNLSKIYWLTEDCKRYGTLPFGGLARLGFVATSILQSLKSAQLLPQFIIEHLETSRISSVGDVIRDASTLPRDEFLGIYGHLRPGTFDVRIPNYKNSYDSYFGWKTNAVVSKLPQDREELSLEFRVASFAYSDKLIDACKALNQTPQDLISWCLSAIRSRELGKFIFSRNISLILDSITTECEKYNLTVDKIAHSSIRTFLEAYKGSGKLQDRLNHEIEMNERIYRVTSSIKMPALLVNPEDMLSFRVAESHPNFVGNESVIGRIWTREHPIDQIQGSIVVLEQADPGFDWIFTRNIKGLVTSFGGANSHMTIRCRETRTPAAIGVGQTIFEELVTSSTVLLDCINQRIQALS